MKNITKELLDEVFRVYTGGEVRSRMDLSDVIVQQGYVYATDAHKIIRCKVDFEVDYKENSKANYSSVFPKEKDSKSIILTLEDLESYIKKTPLVDEIIVVEKEVECSECDGECEVEWEYKRHSECFQCPECNGNGVSSFERTKMTGKKIPDIEGVLDIESVCFKTAHIIVLFETMKKLDIKECFWVVRNPAHSNLFILGDFEVVVMPTMG